MIQVGYNEKVSVWGVTFNGWKDIVEYFVYKKPKDGVYVGEECLFFPCFDEYDYASDSHTWHWVVFAKSEEELEHKLEKIKHMSFPHEPIQELHPMLYWSGCKDSPMCFTDGEEIQTEVK